jgi:uncharacterized protein (TIGR00266 family)
MDIEVISRPAGAAAKIHLSSQEGFTAEAGAMIAMSQDVSVETTSRSRGGKGGILRGLKRLFSGESFFLNHFTANSDEQEVFLGPSMVGDVVVHRLQAGTLVVQGSSWLASSHEVEIDTTFQGVGAALFSGEGIFWVKCSGTGDVLLNAFGGIYELDVDGEHVVDTGHVVAFEDTLSFKVTKAAAGWISSFLSGEGLVCRFRGRGKIYCQTHHPGSFGKALGPKLKARAR